MRDFLRTRWPLWVACLFLAATLPLAAQAPAFTNISGPDVGTVGQPNVWPQSGSVSMNDAPGVRTPTGPGVSLGAAGALGTLTFTGVPGHTWSWQLSYTNGSNIVVLKQNGTNNSVTTHYALTNLYGPNLQPVDPTRTTGDSGTFPPSGTVTVSLGGVVTFDYLQPEGSYSGEGLPHPHQSE